MTDYKNQKIQISNGRSFKGTVKDAVYVDECEYKGYITLKNKKTGDTVDVAVVGHPNNWWFTKAALRG